MDVLTTVWGWLGGKKKGLVPPIPVAPIPAHISVQDIQLFIPSLYDNALYEVSIDDNVLYGITVSDE